MSVSPKDGPLPTPKELGLRIVEARKIAGLSRPALAREVEAAYSAVWRWEHGQQYPPIELLYRIAEVTGTSVQMLLFGRMSLAVEDLPQGPASRVVTLLKQIEAIIKPFAGGPQRRHAKQTGA